MLMMNGDDKSDGQSSAVDFPLNELIELVPADGLISVPTHRVDKLNELFLTVAVFELVVDVKQVVQVQLSLSLDVQECEVGTSTIFVEGVSLSVKESTMRLVSSLRNCSKSRAAP